MVGKAILGDLQGVDYVGGYQHRSLLCGPLTRRSSITAACLRGVTSQDDLGDIFWKPEGTGSIGQNSQELLR